MRLRRLAVPVLAATLAVGLASCTSDSAADKSSAPATSSAGGGTAALAASLKTGIGKLTSAHFTIDATFAGQPLTGSGDQKITDGTLDGLQAAAKLPGVGSVGIVVDGADRFVKLPPPLGQAATPWVRVTSTSSNIIVKQLSGLLDAALTAGSLGNLGGIAAATTSVTKVGSEQVGGAPATHYKLVVDPAKLPGDVAKTAGLGTADIPVELYLDSAQRPVKVTTALSLTGQKAAVTIVFSDFDKPVTITAPPASQIAKD